MYFPLSSIICALTLFGSLFSYTPCVTAYSSSSQRLAQQPLVGSNHVNAQNYTINVNVDTWINAALREGLENAASYRQVLGLGPYEDRDHFIELQYITGVILGHMNIPISSLFTLVTYINSSNNVFRINHALNTRKANKSPRTWLADAEMRAYLCSSLSGPPGVHVYQAVQAFYAAMQADLDANVVAVGGAIASLLNLTGFTCP